MGRIARHKGCSCLNLAGETTRDSALQAWLTPLQDAYVDLRELDVNGDERSDLVNSNGLVFLRQPDGTFPGTPPQKLPPAKDDRTMMGAGNFNGDHRPDVVLLAHGMEQAELALHLNTGSTDVPYRPTADAAFDLTFGDAADRRHYLLRPTGMRRPAQRAVWGFASSAFAKCSDDAIYFAGPQQERLVAVSTRDGSLLWQYREEGNFQLVLHDDALYAMGSSHPSRKLDPLTGEVLLQLPNRAACTRATGSVDRLFVRGRGTRCWDAAADRWLHISPMRPACHDGVLVAGGHLYWGPWMCGCNLSLIGVIGLGPAGDFDYSMKAVEWERLETLANEPANIAPFEQEPDDWAAYRKDALRSSRSGRSVAEEVRLKWEYAPDHSHECTAPVAAGGSVFVAGSDGVVRALDADTGELVWSAYSGGAIRVRPTIAEGRALVGSADGFVYAFEAASGRPLWRFRAAPIQRKIPVYGSLRSTWPVSSGVLVADGVAYAAAGIANYDGTHVYALDVATGAIRWQNNTSGNTDGGQGAGVSVQGDLLLHENKLYLAGGNAIALASYDIADGTFRAAPSPRVGLDQRGPRGHDLFVRHDKTVAVSGSLPMYARPEDVHYIEYAELNCPLGTLVVMTNGVGLLPPEQVGQTKPRARWGARPFNENVAVAVANNAVIVAGTNRQFTDQEVPPAETHGIAALDIQTGKPIWQRAVSAGPVAWGLAIDRQGHVLATLQDGHVLCLGPGT